MLNYLGSLVLCTGCSVSSEIMENKTWKCKLLVYVQYIACIYFVFIRVRFCVHSYLYLLHLLRTRILLTMMG